MGNSYNRKSQKHSYEILENFFENGGYDDANDCWWRIEEFTCAAV